MCNRILFALTILAAAVVVPVNAQAPAEQPPQVFRSAVDLVTIQASVRDAHGRALSGLSPADFEVRDNGQLRPILSLQSDRHSPVSLAILLDISGSMRVGSKIAMARQAFDAVLNQLRDGEDEVALFTFDSSLQERHGFTADFASLKDELWDFEACPYCRKVREVLSELDLDYLDLLNAHWVVDHATLQRSEARSSAAKSILDESKGVREQIRADEAPASVRGPMSKRAPLSRADGSTPPASTRGTG